MEKDKKTYEEFDVCSIRRIKGEREYYRALKIKFYEGVLDMHMYEHTEQGLDMWQQDALKYNTKKFNADVDLLDVDFSEEGAAEEEESRIEIA